MLNCNQKRSLSAMHINLFLILILLCFLQSVTAVSRIEEDISKRAPPPNSKNTRHDEYIKGIKCASVPVGLFGHYLWVAMILSDMVEFSQLWELHKKTAVHSIASLSIGILATIFSIYLMVQDGRSWVSCRRVEQSRILLGTTILQFIHSVIKFFVAVYLSLAWLMNWGTELIFPEEDGGGPRPWWVKLFRRLGLLVITIVVLVILGCAIAILCIQALVLFIQSTITTRDLAKMDVHLGKVQPGPAVIAYLSIGRLVVTIFVLYAVGFMAGIKSRSKRRNIISLCCWGGVLICIGVLLMGPTILSALGNIMMGRIVNDQWGTYGVKPAWGPLTAALIGIVPIVEFIAFIFGSMLGKNRKKRHGPTSTGTSQLKVMR